MKKILFIAFIPALLLGSCGGPSEDVDNPTDNPVDTAAGFDFTDMNEMSLKSEGLNMQIMLPEVASTTGASIEPMVDHEDGDYLWSVNIGSHFHLVIEDFGKEKNKVTNEKNRLADLNKIFVVEYIIDEPNLIMYKRTLHEGQGGKATFHCFGETIIDGYTFVLRSEQDGSYRPIIDDMVKTIRSAKAIEEPA